MKASIPIGHGARPSLVARVAALLSERGAEAYLVGGYVRDLLMGRETRDIDIAVGAAVDPMTIAQALADALGGAFYVLDNERRYARVLVPPKDGEDGEDIALDLTPIHGTLEEDLARRDFTVDAMALPLLSIDDSQAVIDPCGGRRDMDAGLVRALVETVFRDDPARLLRTLRLAGDLGFQIEADTARAVAAHAQELRRVSPERVQDEFCRILALDRARTWLLEMDRLHLLTEVLPELEETRGVEQPREHYWDVLTHLVETVGAFERMVDSAEREADEVLALLPWTPLLDDYFTKEVAAGRTRTLLGKLACLLHDVAKPETKTTEPSGRTRFFGHAERGAEIVHETMERLHFSRRETAFVAGAVVQHLRPMQLSQDLEPPTRRALYRYRRDLGDLAVATLYLSIADYLAAKGPLLEMGEWRRRAAYCAMVLGSLCETAEGQGAVPPRPLVDGHLLMGELGLRPGPSVGRLLAAVQEAAAIGEVSTVEEGLALARRLLREGDQTNNDPGREG